MSGFDAKRIDAKLDDITKILYGLVPVVDRVEKQMEAINIRLGFIETLSSRMDERVTHIEKHHDRDRKSSGIRVKFKDAWDFIKALPVAVQMAYAIPPIAAFCWALIMFIIKYIREHRVGL